MNTGEWLDYIEHNGKRKWYKCPKCREYDGNMKRREVSEPSGDSHKEYQIICVSCGFKSGVHWNKTLTEKVWEAAGVIE